MCRPESLGRVPGVLTSISQAGDGRASLGSGRLGLPPPFSHQPSAVSLVDICRLSADGVWGGCHVSRHFDTWRRDRHRPHTGDIRIPVDMWFLNPDEASKGFCIDAGESPGAVDAARDKCRCIGSCTRARTRMTTKHHTAVVPFSIIPYDRPGRGSPGGNVGLSILRSNPVFFTHDD